ncbi:RusA family crossover junction endodeoxyribonuclease [Clostridia bacterium]|nr:RusA family crossover junction endodeoxyribonuclease [Clostridia bacterium]
MRFTIPGDPRTKKNSSQILRNRRTGKPFVAPSKAYAQYQRDCGWHLKSLFIDEPVNLKCTYYMRTRRKVDLTNLNSAICDVLVHHKVIKDDDSKIIVAMDGSRVRYDKENPRVEIEITRIED